ncbi:LacI family transcriptional regulator [Pseudonocardia kujensis]|uniref:LacI family DNA-binding transcriptional regulator n=1 Tax=Pseudonocardia kujensis TaxID=1128675 RepID=UPI001E5EDFC3|nr:LacI family DNA-binding transcriptional regulator [Pseudonocardia kujensis]MCE0765751.1 LacI family transcriptional regulator [Pseudonocardia kujensis]
MTAPDGPAGPRRATLVEVAARAGVSKSLASLVIRGAPGPGAASRAAVLRAAEELGYRPDPAARLLREHRSRVLGVVFDAGDPFHADLLESVYPAAEHHGYELVLGARVPSHPEHRVVEGLIRSRCEGLLLIATEAEAAGLRELAGRLPVTLVGRRGEGVDAVRAADTRGAAAAVDLLVGLGHRHVRHVDGGRHPGAAERRRGYRSAVRRHGLAPDVVPGDHTEESGVQAARALLDDPGEVTAVFAGNDRCAVGVLDTLRRAGVAVPAEISVMGYDDSRLARLTHVDLTTVAQDAPEMARLAVEAVVARLEGDGDAPPRDLTLAPRLVERGTTGPAPATRPRRTDRPVRP